MELTIRPATPADVDTILDFSRRLNEEDPSPTDDFHFDPAAVRAALLELLVAPPLGRVWLACNTETPIGYAVLTFGFSLESHGRDALLDELYIAAGYRGRGIGTQVIELVEAEARKAGAKKLYLEVERPNKRAQKLYQRLGFGDQGRFLMSKQLT